MELGDAPMDEPYDWDAEEADRVGRWREYWESLTPAERRAEHRAMAEYASEADY